MDQLPIPVARRRRWRWRRWSIPHRRDHRDHRSGRKRRPARRLACIHLLRIGRRRIPDAQLGLPDRFRLPGLRITPRRNPSHRDHLGQRLPERTSKRVQARLRPLLDPSGNLHNPPVTHDAWINYQYQSPGGGGGGGGGGQSPTGGTIVITAPVGNADQNADLHVSISYASGGGGYQTPNWAYRIDSAFPAYGSPHGGTQVTGTTSVNDFLSGQANGSRQRALLDPSGNLHNPPVTHDAWINYQYQSPGGGGGRRRWSIPHRRNHRDHRSGRKRRSKLRLAGVQRVRRRRIPDAQLGLPD